MSLYEIVLMLVGASVFLLGISIGGVIEFKRLKTRAEKREEAYLYNLEQTTQTIYRIENKLSAFASEQNDRWNATKEIHLAVVKSEKAHDIRSRDATPSLPWRINDDPDATDPGFDF